MTNAVIPFPFPQIAPSQSSHPAIAPLLDLALSETHSQGAYLYWFDASGARARIVLWEGPAPSIEAVAQAREVGGAEFQNHLTRTTPIVVHQGAEEDPRFRFFPEFRRNRFEGVVSIPLLDGGAVVGLVNICRSRAMPLQARDLAFLLNLSVPIGSLMAASLTRAALERELDKLTRQLADRKLVERAKGLLQSSCNLTEEQAYFAIRNASRRRRAPMRLVAEQVIEGTFPMAPGGA
jgi:GAF domain-containing protein